MNRRSHLQIHEPSTRPLVRSTVLWLILAYIQCVWASHCAFSSSFSLVSCHFPHRKQQKGPWSEALSPHKRMCTVDTYNWIGIRFHIKLWMGGNSSSWVVFGLCQRSDILLYKSTHSDTNNNGVKNINSNTNYEPKFLCVVLDLDLKSL